MGAGSGRAGGGARAGAARGLRVRGAGRAGAASAGSSDSALGARIMHTGAGAQQRARHACSEREGMAGTCRTRESPLPP
jgi:hypothetical protein